MDKAKMGKLATFNLPYDEDDLRGTPFYSKRDTITKEQLTIKPCYRALKLLKNIAEKNDVEDFRDFWLWVQMPISAYDEQFDQVKKFRRIYGKFKANRYLLTVKNAIDLYIQTEGRN